MSGEIAAVGDDVTVEPPEWRDTPANRPLPAGVNGLRVIQVGPALSVKGGISSVERLILSELQRVIDVRHVATTCDGGPVTKILCFLRSLRSLRRELKGSSRPIVHVHFSARGSTWRKLIVASMALHADARLVLHAHSGGFEKFLGRQLPFVQNWIRRTFQRADLFVVLSTHWREFYLSRLGIDPRRMRVLWNPTRMPLEVPDRSGRKVVHLVYLGLVSHAKGAFDLVKALGQLPLELQQQLKLTIAGNGDLEGLRAAAGTLRAIVDIRSWITETQRDALLCEADLFVLPSYFEGVPMSILEAMAAGLPVISTRVGGVPEIVVHEQTGVLIEAGDLVALRTQIERLATDETLRLQYGRAARMSVERFDIRGYARELMEHYRALSTQG